MFIIKNNSGILKSLMLIVTASLVFVSCDLITKNNNADKGQKKQIVKEFYPNGRLKSVNEVIGDKRDGTCTYYNENGSVKATVEFQNNLYHGKYISYYDNKKKHSEITYVAHKKSGPAFTYYENGKIALEENYLDGELNGFKRKYHGNGVLMMENEYKNGQPSVNLKEFDANGKQKTNYPTIQIEAIDRMKLEQKFILKVSFSDKSRSAVFYEGDLTDNKFLPAYLPEYTTTNGVALIEIPAPPGTVIMKTITIIGKKRTSDGNTFVASKKYNLAIKN